MIQKNLNERMAVVETTQEHMQETIDKMALQLNEVHQLLIAAKGARWAVVTIAMLIGFVLASITNLAAMFGGKPNP